MRASWQCAAVVVPFQTCIIHHVFLACLGSACLHGRLIFTLREYPSTEDFVYLRRFQHHPADGNPYALEVVQFANVDQSNYYTISVRGISHYINGLTEECANSNDGPTAGLLATIQDVLQTTCTARQLLSRLIAYAFNQQ
jgi:hypothetical protein